MLDFEGIGYKINVGDVSSVFTDRDLNFLQDEIGKHYCYYNAFYSCLFHHLKKETNYYVEGYVQTQDGELLPHAFNMKDGGLCYDLTKHFYFDEAELIYYLKRVYTYEEINSIFDKVGLTFLTITDEGKEMMREKDIYLVKNKQDNVSLVTILL